MDWNLKRKCICRLCGHYEELPTDYIDIYGESGEKRLLRQKIKDAVNLFVHKDDLLPRYICNTCCNNLNFICDFKKSCKKIQEKFDEVLKLQSTEWSLCDTQANVCENGNIPAGHPHYQDLDLLTHLHNSQSNKCNEALHDSREAWDEMFAALNVEGTSIIDKAAFPKNLRSEVNIQEESLCVLSDVSFESTEVQAFAQTPDLNTIESSAGFELHVDHVKVSDEDGINFREKVDDMNLMPSELKNPKVVTISLLSIPAASDDDSALQLAETLALNDTQSCPFEDTSIRQTWIEISRVQCGVNTENEESSIASKELQKQCNKNLNISNEKPRRNHVRVPPSTFVRQEVEKLSAHLYKCQICGKTFHWKYQCEYHVREHIGEKQFHCICGKSFPAMYALKRHALVHSNSDFLCQLCGKSFKSAGNLRVHGKVHDNDGFKYVCDVCGKVFRYKQSFSFHVQKHIGNFEFVCEICGLKYVNKRDLNLHVKRHRGEKPHKCPTCRKSFLKKFNMKRHLRLHIKDDGKKES